MPNVYAPHQTEERSLFENDEKILIREDNYLLSCNPWIVRRSRWGILHFVQNRFSWLWSANPTIRHMAGWSQHTATSTTRTSRPEEMVLVLVKKGPNKQWSRQRKWKEMIYSRTCNKMKDGWRTYLADKDVFLSIFLLQIAGLTRQQHRQVWIVFVYDQGTLVLEKYIKWVDFLTNTCRWCICQYRGEPS